MTVSSCVNKGDPSAKGRGPNEPQYMAEGIKGQHIMSRVWQDDRPEPTTPHILRFLMEGMGGCEGAENEVSSGNTELQDLLTVLQGHPLWRLLHSSKKRKRHQD